MTTFLLIWLWVFGIPTAAGMLQHERGWRTAIAATLWPVTVPVLIAFGVGLQAYIESKKK